MASAKTETWQLFVDESGSFRHDETSLVAGVLVRAAAPSKADFGALRRAIERALPFVPYPPHAAEVHHPASIATAAMVGHPAFRSHSAVAAAVGAIESSGAPEAMAVRAALQRGDRLRFDSLVACSTWLAREQPAAHGALVAMRDEGYSRLARVMRAFGEETGAFVVASAHHPDDPLFAPPGGETFDPYLVGLSGTIERALMLLRANDDTQRTLWIVPATRHVALLGMPAMAMSVRAVGSAAEVAASVEPLATHPMATDATVRVLATAPVRWDASVPPGVVLADFIGFRLRPIAGYAKRWQSLCERLADLVALPLVAAPRLSPSIDPLPALAAEGDARRSVRAALSGETPDAGGAAWRRDQAEAWITAAPRLREAAASKVASVPARGARR